MNNTYTILCYPPFTDSEYDCSIDVLKKYLCKDKTNLFSCIVPPKEITLGKQDLYIPEDSNLYANTRYYSPNLLIHYNLFLFNQISNILRGEAKNYSVRIFMVNNPSYHYFYSSLEDTLKISHRIKDLSFLSIKTTSNINIPSSIGHDSIRYTFNYPFTLEPDNFVPISDRYYDYIFTGHFSNTPRFIRQIPKLGIQGKVCIPCPVNSNIINSFCSEYDKIKLAVPNLNVDIDFCPLLYFYSDILPYIRNSAIAIDYNSYNSSLKLSSPDIGLYTYSWFTGTPAIFISTNTSSSAFLEKCVNPLSKSKMLNVSFLKGDLVISRKQFNSDLLGNRIKEIKKLRRMAFLEDEAFPLVFVSAFSGIPIYKTPEDRDIIF